MTGGPGDEDVIFATEVTLPLDNGCDILGGLPKLPGCDITVRVPQLYGRDSCSGPDRKATVELGCVNRDQGDHVEGMPRVL